MDLNTFKTRLDPVEFRLTNPINGDLLDGENDPVFYVLHPQSDPVQAVQKRIQENILKNPNKKQTVERIKENALIILCASLDSWKNVSMNGVELECTKENKMELLSNPELYWIEEQLFEFLNKTENFISRS